MRARLPPSGGSLEGQAALAPSPAGRRHAQPPPRRATTVRRALALRAVLVAIATLALPPAAARAGTAETRSFALAGAERTYLRYAPEGACGPAATPAPLVVLHHGTGGDGSELVRAWRAVADREGILLAAPAGTGRHGWQVPQDGPVLHRELVRHLRGECAVDPRRIYLAGFSNGGDHAFFVALSQSRFFAAAAVLCAALRPRQLPMLDLVPRRIPLFYMVAERDAVYPLAETRATRAALRSRRWPLSYRELRGEPHGHPPGFAAEAWAFLRGQRLDEEPEFVELDERWLSFALR